MASENRPFALPPSGTTRTAWAWDSTGPSNGFRLSLERGLERHFDDVRRGGSDEQVAIEPSADRLTYTITGMTVPGDPFRHEVRIEFHRTPDYTTFGLAAEDFPRVWTDDQRPKLHAYPIPTTSLGPLCLWYPRDPPSQRWTSRETLVELIELVRRHLYLEHHHRVHGVWLMDDAPHGIAEAS